MNELLARCAGTFTPKSVDDFIGNNIIERQSGDQTGARLVALQIEKAVRLADKHGQTPLKFLFNGPTPTPTPSLPPWPLPGRNKSVFNPCPSVAKKWLLNDQ